MHMHACFQLFLVVLTSHEHRQILIDSSAISSLKSFLHIRPHHHVVVLKLHCRRSCHRANKIRAWQRSWEKTTTNIAEVLKLAAKPVQYDNDEKTCLEFRFKLENHLTLVDERYVALLLNAESQPVANLPTGTEESAVTIRTLSHTLYALLATLTTGRSLRQVQRVPNRNGFEAWRQMTAENAPKTAGRRFAMLQAVPQPGMSDNPAKFEETWKSWEHQVDIYENLSSTKAGRLREDQRGVARMSTETARPFAGELSTV